MLVVCHGNICRSPFAAALLQRHLSYWGVHVASAGFIGPNRPCPPEGVAVAALRGLDLSSHRSRLLADDEVRRAGLIVVMDPAQARAICDRFGRLPRDVVTLGDLDPLALAPRVILDPVEQGLDAFAESYAQIERCVEQLVSAIAAMPPLVQRPQEVGVCTP